MSNYSNLEYFPRIRVWIVFGFEHMFFCDIFPNRHILHKRWLWYCINACITFGRRCVFIKFALRLSWLLVFTRMSETQNQIPNLYYGQPKFLFTLKEPVKIIRFFFRRYRSFSTNKTRVTCCHYGWLEYRDYFEEEATKAFYYEIWTGTRGLLLCLFVFVFHCLICRLFIFQAINKARREGAVIDTQAKCKYSFYLVV